MTPNKMEMFQFTFAAKTPNMSKTCSSQRVAQNYFESIKTERWCILIFTVNLDFNLEPSEFI
jgi:hypothetical protein